MKLTHVSCAYGGTGVSAPGHIGLIVYFEVATSVALVGLEVVELEVDDAATGKNVARAVPPIELRVSLPGRDEHYNLRTAPFAGVVAAGASLRLCASAFLTPIENDTRAQRRYRASVRVARADGERCAPLLLEGPLDQPWSTAGPARPA